MRVTTRTGDNRVRVTFPESRACARTSADLAECGFTACKARRADRLSKRGRREDGAGFGPDAVPVGADDLSALPGAPPFGPPLLEPAAGPCAGGSEQGAEGPVLRPTRCARRCLAARSWTRLRRRESQLLQRPGSLPCLPDDRRPIGRIPLHSVANRCSIPGRPSRDRGDERNPMGVMHILDQNGDTAVSWDVCDARSFSPCGGAIRGSHLAPMSGVCPCPRGARLRNRPGEDLRPRCRGDHLGPPHPGRLTAWQSCGGSNDFRQTAAWHR